MRLLAPWPDDIPDIDARSHGTDHAPRMTTPDLGERDREQHWQQAWLLLERGQAREAAAIFQRLCESGRTGAATALGHAWHRAGEWDKATEAFNAAIASEDDDEARLALLETRFDRLAARNLPADHNSQSEIESALALAAHVQAYHPYAAVMAGGFCLHLAQRQTDAAHRRAWTDRARACFEAAHRAGLLAGTARLARLLWRQGNWPRSIALRLRALRALFVAWRNGPDDPSLYGLHDPPPPAHAKTGKRGN